MKREKDSFLVTANITELPKVTTFDTNLPLTSDPIPEPWSTTSTYTLKIPLTPGISPSPTHALVNFLIPRGQFLASPFGQAVLRNSEVPGAGSLGGPLLSDIFSNPSDQNQASLECYWQRNTFTSGSTVTGCGGGPFPDSFHSVQVLSLAQGASAASCEDSYPSLCGGVPGNPGLSAIAPSPALQGVIALNLSFLDPNNNPSPVDLDTLLAGLLDNATGGVNGTFRDETQNLSFLGLAAPVMSALANGVWDSGGIFGPPVSYAQPNPPSPPTCSGFLGCVWNTVSGIVVGIAGAIYGAVWTAVEAATQFMKQLGAGLAHLAEVAEQAAVSALTAVGAALEAALQALINAVVRAVENLLSPIWDRILSGLESYFSGISTSLGTLTSGLFAAVTQPSSGNTAQAMTDGASFGLSLVDAQGIASTLSSTFQDIATVMQPILNLINVPTLMNKVMGFLENGPLQHYVDAIGGILSAGVSGVVSVIRSLLTDAGLEAQVPSTLLTSQMNGLLGNGPQLGQFIAAGGVSSVVSGFLTEFLNQISTPYGYIDFLLTIVAAETFGASIFYNTLGSGLRAGVNIIGIVLTGVGLGLFGIGGFCDDVWSMFADLASFWSDLTDIYALKEATPVGLLADGIDAFADWYDIFLAANNAMSLTPEQCLPL